MFFYLELFPSNNIIPKVQIRLIFQNYYLKNILSLLLLFFELIIEFI